MVAITTDRKGLPAQCVWVLPSLLILRRGLSRSNWAAKDIGGCCRAGQLNLPARPRTCAQRL